MTLTSFENALLMQGSLAKLTARITQDQAKATALENKRLMFDLHGSHDETSDSSLLVHRAAKYFPENYARTRQIR